jgi:hypothetical protein
MARYTVLWRTDVVNELANRWIAYHDRPALSAAADQLDVMLAADAHLKGNLLQVGQKTIANGPLAVLFRVDEGDRKVMVEGVWLTESN